MQVVDPSGVVIASTDNLAGRDPVADLEGGETTVVEGLPLDEGEGEFLVVAQTTATDEGMQTVLVGRALEPVSESTGAVAGFVVVGIPMLLLVIGAVTWLVVGRALAPVEAIRSEVQTISGEKLESTGSGSTGGRRDRTPRSDDERDARPPGTGTGPPAPARLRRLPRAALPDRGDPSARGGRHRAPRSVRRRGTCGSRARGGSSTPADGRGSAAPDPHRRGHLGTAPLGDRPRRHRARRSLATPGFRPRGRRIDS